MRAGCCRFPGRERLVQRVFWIESNSASCLILGLEGSRTCLPQCENDLLEDTGISRFVCIGPKYMTSGLYGDTEIHMNIYVAYIHLMTWRFSENSLCQRKWSIEQTKASGESPKGPLPHFADEEMEACVGTPSLPDSCLKQPQSPSSCNSSRMPIMRFWLKSQENGIPL